MFSTFQFHDLKELIESKVRYLASPEPFHTFNIQGFKEQCIVFPAQTCRKFPMPIKTLPGDLPILPAKDTQCFEPPLDRNTLRLKGLLKDRSLLYPRLKYWGPSILVPSERVRYVFNPKSTPTLLPVLGNGSELSTLSQLKHTQ